MPDYTSLFARQAEASVHVHFVYELVAGQLVFVNDAYRAVLHGEPDQANTALPGTGGLAAGCEGKQAAWGAVIIKTGF